MPGSDPTLPIEPHSMTGRRHLEFLLLDWLGNPAWMWLGFVSIVGVLLALDLGVLHRKQKEIGVRESLVLSAGYIVLGVSFAGLVWLQLGETAGIQYLTGFVVEKSLALDNVFVIALIFGYFAVPRQYQHRVLFWGILGVIVLRAIMIGIGATLVAEFAWVLYVFAAFLILTGIKMLALGDKETDLSKNPVLKLIRRRFRVTEELHGERFLVKLPDPRTGRPVRYMTPLFLALILIEIADVIFAVDSVPAIFAITTDPYIVYTSNIFAILGLRALYFALAAVLHRFAYLKQALAVLLIFIGSKIFVADFLGLDKFPAIWSLGATFAILAAGIVYSLWRTRNPAPAVKGKF
ncbi:TerC family protein [Mycolicibacterium aubagnense]|jgi:tellurite resistance protein TerC